jgi:hypothetical protein
MIAEELQRILRTSPDVNFVVRNINSVMLEFAGLKENPVDADSQWHEHSLLKVALKGLEQQPFLRNFSPTMIDEFQDLVDKPSILSLVLSL